MLYVGFQVSKVNPKDNSYVLRDDFYKFVQKDWPGYSEEERQLISRLLARWVRGYRCHTSHSPVPLWFVHFSLFHINLALGSSLLSTTWFRSPPCFYRCLSALSSTTCLNLLLGFSSSSSSCRFTERRGACN